LGTITVNGASLAVSEAGTGGPPFVFIHGLACDQSAWAPQFDDLSRDHRCISIDLRGRGGSAAIPPYGCLQQADDIVAIMRELGTGPSILVGHSLGGLVALLMNERHPELVLGIVMGDTPVRPGGLQMGALAQAVRDAGSVAPLAPMVERFWTEETAEPVKEQVRQMMLTCPAEVAAGMLDDAPDDRMLELVKLADKKPFMAIWAERPAGDPAWLRDVAMFIRQEPMAGGGHFFQLEKPAVTNALLRAFLDDVERDPRIAR
jgi:pimeloyl-ACP methyl ester carboxylesterase